MQEEESRHRRAIPEAIVPKSFPEASALAGVLAYAATYFACVRFYAPFGIEPADVGLGYADMLGQAAVLLAFAFALGFVVGGIVYIPYRFVDIWRQERSERYKRVDPLKQLLAIALVAGAITGVCALLIFAIADSRKVRDGKAVSGFYELAPWADATVATIRWTGAGTRPPPPIPPCVIRLGEAGGTEIFYDPEADATLRLPQTSIAVTLEPKRASCES